MVGVSHSEEEKKQKTIKGILNKLTPDNFGKLVDQIKAIDITEHITLEGLIDQIFDKALNEITFCPLYSELCRLLSNEMPEFDLAGDTRKVNLKLNERKLIKCHL